VESLSSLRWNQCPVCRGIGVHFGLEYALLTLTLNYIEKHGYEAFYKDCCNNDYNVALEHLFTSLDDVFDVEHYRGKIPDGIVQKMYSKCQNYAYSAEKKAIIRERMG
jgi:hypothetical protein